MDKKERKEMLKKLKEEANQKARAELPLKRDDLADLFDFLDEALLKPCDHSLNKTKSFLEPRNLVTPEIIDWFYKHGGGCDCEVLANVEPFCAGMFGVKSGDRLTRENEETYE